MVLHDVESVTNPVRIPCAQGAPILHDSISGCIAGIAREAHCDETMYWPSLTLTEVSHRAPKLGDQCSSQD